ncbi:MAG: site-2 protease family protein, partial [Armatimonadetes bacterium]|nr:site-2 protease family protein [Armatimonadota bacterium]
MILWQIVAVLLMFTVVVAIHELGHFLFARWRGMEVEEFAIGFGKKLLSRTARSGTEFTIRIVPLGGFVRIKGMIPQPDASEEKISGGFYAQGLGSQALVLFAGPLFSVLGGFFLFFSNYAAFGEPVASEEPLIGG